MKFTPIVNSTFLCNVFEAESALEQLLLSKDEMLAGLIWGTPRRGHPEGAVWLHVWEVLRNIDILSANILDPLARKRLRLVALIHDSFKYQEEATRPRKDWSKHHAVIARKFAEKYIEDTIVLDLIELHDEFFYAWLLFKKDEAASLEKLNKLINNISTENLHLMYYFFKCDTQTGDKLQEPLIWFDKYIAPIFKLDIVTINEKYESYNKMTL